MKIFTFVFSSIVCLTTIVTANAEPAKLGLVLPLSGEYAFVGSGVRDGINMALAEDAASTDALKITFEDDEGLNRKATVTGVKKLIEVDHVDLLGVTAVNTVTSVAKLVENARLPTLVIWDSNEHIHSLGSYIFGYGFSNEAAGIDMADFATKNLGAKSASIIYAQDEWSEIVTKSFSKQFGATGGKVQKEYQTTLGETDFRSIVSEIKRNNPDVVYAPLLSGALRSALKQLKQAGYPGKILTGDGFSDADIEALAGAAEGVYVMQMWYADPSFQNKYLKHFKRNSDGVNLCFAALGYDFINYVKAVVKNNQGSLKASVESTAFKGLLGDVNFSKSQLSNRRETVLVVKNGKMEAVK